MKRIIFEPSSVWQYYKINKTKLGDNMVLLAKNEEYGVEIYLGSDGEYPQFLALVDGDIDLHEFAMNEEDCVTTLNEIFDEYLEASFVQNAINEEIDDGEYDVLSDDEAELQDIVDVVKSREGALVSAMLDFLLETMDSDDAISEDGFWDKLQDCLEHTLKYISDKGFPVYRPMLIRDEETQEISLVEFPYKEYDFS